MCKITYLLPTLSSETSFQSLSNLPKKDFSQVSKKLRLTTKKYVHFKQPKFYFINQ